MAQSVYEFSAGANDGADVALEQYRGKVLLVVNTASECGFTPQYEGLQALHAEFHDRGLVVLGFPCNQFGAQEPGTDEQIREFCSVNYGVTFPLMAKVEVNGADAHPLFEFLKDHSEGTASDIRWNFTKLPVGGDGTTITRFEPDITPEDIVASIEQALGAT